MLFRITRIFLQNIRASELKFLINFQAFSINVELVSGDHCAKYVLKYIMKGSDMCFTHIDKDRHTLKYDEFHQMRLARYITSMESFLTLLGEPLVRKSHEVNLLYCNLYYSLFF